MVGKRCLSLLLVPCWLLACGHSRTATNSALPAPSASASAQPDAGIGPDDRLPGLVIEEEGPEQPGEDPTLGVACVADTQCNDGVNCTADSCDLDLGRCRHSPDPTSCQDSLFCNGPERCDVKLGCAPGGEPPCQDQSTCTIDRCDEATDTCSHESRDADQDGDPDIHCPGGGDCNDRNALVSSTGFELCGNGVDDDCDMQIDELDCRAPMYQDCAALIPWSGSGSAAVDFRGLTASVGASCIPTETREALIQIDVAEVTDVVIELTTAGLTDAFLAVFTTCEQPESELACAASVNDSPFSLSRLRLRSLEPGSYWVRAYSSRPTEAEFRVDFLPASVPPSNEDCAGSAPLTPGASQHALLVDAERDLPSECWGELGGELLYELVLSEPQDLELFATTEQFGGLAILSLRNAGCAGAGAELACSVSGQLHARALPAGTYHVAVGATGPVDVQWLAQLKPPTSAPLGDGCSQPIALTAGAPVLVDLTEHAPTPGVGCLEGAQDAFLEVATEQRSDLMLAVRGAPNDPVAIGLLRGECGAEAAITCAPALGELGRAVHHDLPSGRYIAVVESAEGEAAEVSLLQRPSTPPRWIQGAEGCDSILDVGDAGGFFQGNTTGVRASLSAGCDQGTVNEGGAGEQLLRLVLAERRRVVLDMSGSSYRTLLQVRAGESCPGEPVSGTCRVGRRGGRSYLDTELDAGTYYIQIDGYAWEEGQWNLDVFLGAPAP